MKNDLDMSGKELLGRLVLWIILLIPISVVSSAFVVGAALAITRSLT